jgi:HCOMODA/2-hydroxy-3-carboxy-muconic semialdehyde decarboxylase
VDTSCRDRRLFLSTLAAAAPALFLVGRDAAVAHAAAAALAPAQSAEAVDPQVVDDLVAANRILADQGVLDGMGHVSVRHPRRNDRFLLARSMAPALVQPADIMEYAFNGDAVAPAGRASYQERFIHTEIYRVRADVNAIVHCHTPSLIPFADTDVPLRAMYHMAAFVAEGVPVFDIRKAAGITDLLVKDAPLGRALAETLGARQAALMRGHGAVIVARTIPDVVGRSVYLDLNARAQAQAIALGGRITSVDPAEARLRMADPAGEYTRAWDLWKRQLTPGK